MYFSILSKLILLPCYVPSGLISTGITSWLLCLLTVVLAADVPFRLSALTRSCVVIPCSFQYPEDAPLTRGIWSKKNGGVIFHNGQSQVLDHFKGRTKMSKGLDRGNCSLEIDDIKPFDNGPFCFHAEKGNDKYRFNNSCVFIVMKGINNSSAYLNVPSYLSVCFLYNKSTLLSVLHAQLPPKNQ